MTHLSIGPHQLENRLILAPMAGVTDLPFRLLCRGLGAGLAIAEMLSANPALRNSEKTRQRMDHSGESGLRAIQIAGADPVWMADAARFNVAHGAQLIDINMGCPAKKVCNKYAGSALMGQPELAVEIMQAVVSAVAVPVTLKMRTGLSPEHSNAVALALAAERAGIQAITVHGRSRAQFYKGAAEYDTIKAVKQAVAIPVIANGDIDSPEKAEYVLRYTGADALMIGRAAHGNPWIFREIAHYLDHGRHCPPPTGLEVANVLQDHVQALHRFYGEYKGLRIARKHVGWYLEHRPQGETFSAQFNAIENAENQLAALQDFCTGTMTEMMADINTQNSFTKVSVFTPDPAAKAA